MNFTKQLTQLVLVCCMLTFSTACDAQQERINQSYNDAWGKITKERIYNIKSMVPDNDFLPLKKTVLETNKGTESSGSISGAYFIFVGSMHGSYESHLAIQQEVYFAWKGLSGYYNNSHISLDKVKIEVGNFETPSIMFVYKSGFKNLLSDTRTLVDIESCRRQGGTYYGTPGDWINSNTCASYTLYDSSEQDIINRHIDYVVIRCKEDQWKPEFNLDYKK